jgi:hypothetical protein
LIALEGALYTPVQAAVTTRAEQHISSCCYRKRATWLR